MEKDVSTLLQAIQTEKSTSSNYKQALQQLYALLETEGSQIVRKYQLKEIADKLLSPISTDVRNTGCVVLQHLCHDHTETVKGQADKCMHLVSQLSGIFNSVCGDSYTGKETLAPPSATFHTLLAVCKIVNTLLLYLFTAEMHGNNKSSSKLLGGWSTEETIRNILYCLTVYHNTHVNASFMKNPDKGKWNSIATDKHSNFIAQAIRLLGYVICTSSCYKVMKKHGGLPLIHQTLKVATRNNEKEGKKNETTDLCCSCGWIIVACCLHDDDTNDAVLDMPEAEAAIVWASERHPVAEGGLQLSPTQQKLTATAMQNLNLRDTGSSSSEDQDDDNGNEAKSEHEEKSEDEEEEGGSRGNDGQEGEEEDQDTEDHHNTQKTDTKGSEEGDADATREDGTTTLDSTSQVSEDRLTVGKGGDNKEEDNTTPQDGNTTTPTPDAPLPVTTELTITEQQLSTTTTEGEGTTTPPEVSVLGTMDKMGGDTLRGSNPNFTGLGVNSAELDMMRKRELLRENQLALLKEEVSKLQLQLANIEKEEEEDGEFDDEVLRAVAVLKSKTKWLQLTQQHLKSLEQNRMAQEDLLSKVTLALQTTIQRANMKEKIADKRLIDLEEKLKAAEEQASRLSTRSQQLDMKAAELDLQSASLHGNQRQRDEEFSQREQRLDAREKRLEGREDRTEEREAIALARENDRDKDLREREFHVRKIQEENKQAQLKLEEKEHGVSAILDELRLRGSNISEQEVSLTKKIEEFETREGKFNDQVIEQQRLARIREAELGARETKMNDLESELKKRESLISSLENELEQDLMDDDEQALQLVAQAYGKDDKTGKAVAKAELLKRSQVEAAKLRSTIRQKWVKQRKERMVKEYAQLCEAEYNVRKLAHTFKMAVGRLCLFDVDYLDDDNENSANTFSKAELQAIFSAIRRERELAPEEGMMKQMRQCPWAQRNKYVTDTEIIARMDVWWRDWLKYFDSRWGGILAERRQYLHHAIKVLERKRAQFPIIASIPSASTSMDFGAVADVPPAPFK